MDIQHFLLTSGQVVLHAHAFSLNVLKCFSSGLHDVTFGEASCGGLDIFLNLALGDERRRKHKDASSERKDIQPDWLCM